MECVGYVAEFLPGLLLPFHGIRVVLWDFGGEEGTHVEGSRRGLGLMV